MKRRISSLLAPLFILAACGPAVEQGPPAPEPTFTPQESGTTALLQAVSPVDDTIVWVSGHQGTYARTTDGGRTWHAARVPGADTLQFRDVHAVSADVAYLLSAGPGELSRIYKTTDGGQHWTLQFRNEDPEAFFDCLAFWDAERGVAFSDAVDGRFPILVTGDGGLHWEAVPADHLPAALPGEGSFAASGTCVVTGPDGLGWIGTGNASPARVFRTTDYGRTWQVFTTPIVSGEAAGITSLAFRDAEHGIALGGDLGRPDEHTDNVAVTRDGGRTWSLAGRPSFTGAVYGSAFVPGTASPLLVAAGPKGLALPRDEGRSWVSLDTLNYWAVGFASPEAGWAVGPGGRITHISIR